MNANKCDTSTLDELDTLIAKGKGVRGMFGSAQDFYEEAFEEWRVSSQDFILEKLGEDSRFYKDFAVRVTEPTLSGCDIGIEILTAIRRSLEESRPKKGESSATIDTAPQDKPKRGKTPAAAVEQEKAQAPMQPRPETGMIPKAYTLERLDTLIAKGKGVRGMFGSAGGLHEDAFEEWRVSSLDFIQEELGEDSQYYKDFATRATKPTLSSCNIGIGVLTAIKMSLEESFLKEAEPSAAVETGPQEKEEKAQRPEPTRLKFADIEETVTAEPEKPQKKPGTEKPPARAGRKKKKPRLAKEPHREAEETPEKKPVKEEPCEAAEPSGIKILENVLWQAQVQLSQEHKDAAAVLCGAVLEETLRWMCSRHDIPVKEWDTVGDLNDKLLSKGLYDESMHNKIVSWWYLREDAQSANHVYDKKDVANMASGLHDFLKDNFPTFATQNPGGKVREV